MESPSQLSESILADNVIKTATRTLVKKKKKIVSKLLHLTIQIFSNSYMSHHINILGILFAIGYFRDAFSVVYYYYHYYYNRINFS